MTKRSYLVLGLLAAVIAGSGIYVGSDLQPVGVQTPAPERPNLLPAEGAAPDQHFISMGFLGAETPEEAARAIAYRAEHERAAQDSLTALRGVPAPMPLAMREIGPSAGLEADQIDAILRVREQFTRAMQAAGNSHSPKYLERWLAEQQEADNLLVAYLGAELLSQLDLRPE